jgi:hypothetical protein
MHKHKAKVLSISSISKDARRRQVTSGRAGKKRGKGVRQASKAGEQGKRARQASKAIEQEE